MEIKSLIFPAEGIPSCYNFKNLEAQLQLQSQLIRSCYKNLTWNEISGIMVQLQPYGTVTTWKNLENWKILEELEKFGI